MADSRTQRKTVRLKLPAGDGDLDGLMAATLAMGVSGMKRGEAQAED